MLQDEPIPLDGPKQTSVPSGATPRTEGPSPRAPGLEVVRVRTGWAPAPADGPVGPG
jgi:hypothetical protein